MRRGDIYWVDLEPTQGREQRGHRPVVIVSPDDFNQATGLPVVVPITSGGDFARRIGFAVPLCGTQTTGVVRCDQPRVLDLNARNGRRVESLPAAILDEILAKTSTICGHFYKSPEPATLASCKPACSTLRTATPA